MDKSQAVWLTSRGWGARVGGWCPRLFWTGCCDLGLGTPRLCRPAHQSSCHHVIMSSCHHVIMSSCSHSPWLVSASRDITLGLLYCTRENEHVPGSSFIFFSLFNTSPLSYILVTKEKVIILGSYCWCSFTVIKCLTVSLPQTPIKVIHQNCKYFQ